MKFIITESKLETLSLSFLKKKYGNLKLKENDSKNWDYLIYQNKDKTIFIFDTILEIVHISSDVYHFLYDNFNLNYDQMKNVIKTWVKEDYDLNIKDFFPF
jgi:hypothetical protein